MKKIKKNLLIILKKIKFTKYFWIFGIFLFMLTNFCSTSFLINSSTDAKKDVSNEKIIDLFEKNVEKKKLIYKFLNEFKKEKEVAWGSSIQSLEENKYLVGTYNKGFWLLKFDDNKNQFDYFSFEKGDLIFNSLFGSVDINVFISKEANTVFKIEESINKLTINKNNINSLSNDDKLNLINLINLFEFLSKYNTKSNISADDKVLNFDFIKEILNKKSLSSEQKDIALGLKKDGDYTIYKDEDSKTIPIITSEDLTLENQITFKKLTQILKTITDDNDHSKKIK